MWEGWWLAFRGWGGRWLLWRMWRRSSRVTQVSPPKIQLVGGSGHANMRVLDGNVHTEGPPTVSKDAITAAAAAGSSEILGESSSVSHPKPGNKKKGKKGKK